MNKTKKTTKSNNRTKNVSRKLWLQPWFLLPGGVILLLLIIGLLSGYVQFTAAYLRCGQKPVIVDKVNGALYRPYYILPTDGSLYSIHLGNQYYCSTVDAESTGATLSPLSGEK